jgi:hypothetical protein
MQPNRLTTKPENEVISAIQTLDLESVKARLMDEELGEGWTREYADSIEQAYKRYLSMLVKYQDHAEDIMLAKDVDEFWHTHILQTMKYSDDCQRVFGAYLHHNPHVGPRTEAVLAEREALAEKTRRLYEREFENAPAAWAGHIMKSAVVSVDAAQAAFSTTGIRSQDAAFSTIGIRAENAAFSTIGIRSENAAFSTIGIQAENAAFSTIGIRAEDAAFSTIGIRSENAAFSTIGIRQENAAFSTIGVRPESELESAPAAS